MKILLTVLVLFLAVSTVLIFSTPAHAQLIPFGGQVIFTIPCTCSIGLLHIIGPPTPGGYLQVPLTRVYREYVMGTPSVWLLGNSTPGGSCLIYIGTGCVPAPFPVRGTMMIVGTSLPGI